MVTKPYVYSDKDFTASLDKECLRLRKKVLELAKDDKRDMSFEEFKRYMRGVTLKSKGDFVKALNWLCLDPNGPIRGWKLYWNQGIDGRS